MHTLPICSRERRNASAALFAAECFRCLVRGGRSCFAILSVVIVTALANAAQSLCSLFAGIRSRLWSSAIQPCFHARTKKDWCTHCPSVHASGGMLPLPCSRRSLLLRNPLGRDSNSLGERGTEPVLPICRDSFTPLELSNPTLLPRPNEKRLVHTLPVCSRERRASAQSHAQCGYDHDKKVLLDFFQKIAGVQRAGPLGTYRHALSNGLFLPSLDQESSRTLSRGSRYEKRGSMPLFPYLCEHVTLGLRCHWNYVGRHGADRFSTSYTRGLSGGQFTAHRA